MPTLMVLGNIYQSELFAGKGMSGEWNAFTSVIVRVQSMHVQVRVKGKTSKSDEPWMTREIEALVRKRGRHGSGIGG